MVVLASPLKQNLRWTALQMAFDSQLEGDTLLPHHLFYPVSPHGHMCSTLLQYDFGTAQLILIRSEAILSTERGI